MATSKVTTTIVTELLIDCYNIVVETMAGQGDGPIIDGVFKLSRYGLVLMARNANNHQLTRGVLEGALTAAWQYMRVRQYKAGSQATISFKIYDGVNQVGDGTITRATKSA